jgi:CRISPR-associated exonuclease Cas4
MMFCESDLLPISALQHLAFCERQWALIHLEGIWTENRLTAEGRSMHERADEADTEVRGDIRIARCLKLRSLRFGLTGKADIVEFYREREERVGKMCKLDGVDGFWRPVPVEYKHGSPKPEPYDEIQLCAQALCLEEMLNVKIEEGAIFYGRPRRREAVQFDDGLRTKTDELVSRLHKVYHEGKTPPAQYEKHCESCSLIDQCMPRITEGKKSVEKYLDQALINSEKE